MIATTMPLFSYLDLADYALTKAQEHWLTALFLFCGFFALGMISLVMHDTRDDGRSEMQDTEPKPRKVVQISDKARTYTDADYWKLLAETAKGRSSDEVIAEINAEWDKAKAEAAAKWAARRKEQA